MNPQLKNQFSFDRIEPYYQPILDISNGTVYGYECLPRLTIYGGEPQSAGWIFDDNGIDIDTRESLDRLIKFKALDHFKSNINDAHIFLNVKPSWISRIDISIDSPLVKMVEAQGIDPQRVVVEITEKHIGTTVIHAYVKRLKAAGIKIAIDDFGADDSQIDQIIALAPDFIKLDMRFFKGPNRKSKQSKMAVTLTNIAEQLNFELICEGVETEQEFDFSIECGAQKIQGWYFSKARRETCTPFFAMGKINERKNNYLKRKRQNIKHSLNQQHHASRMINNIVESYLEHSLNTLDASQIEAAGIMRLYVCNQEGRQLSPNFNFKEGKVQTCTHSLGWNWCHRPYFSMLSVLCESRLRKHCVSKNYLDTLSRRYCKTHSFILPDNTIALIDVLTEDTLLYCT